MTCSSTATTVTRRTREVAFDGELRIVSRRAEADGVISLRLATGTGDPLPEWSPGAHLDVLLPTGFVRQYSLCGPVEDRSTWRIGVLRESDGRGGSAWLHDNATEGGLLRVRGPRNNFPLLPARRYVFIAGGIGITPLLPMIAEAQRAGADWVLHYGGRTSTSMAFLPELRGHAGRVLVRPEDTQGRLDLAAVLGEPQPSTLVYCCGPGGLIDAVRDRCRGWPAGSLHVERFTPVEPPEDEVADGPATEVECTRSGVTLTVPPGTSILEAAERAGISVLSSCSEGICGTCETEVLGGEVEHRDSVLTDEEREEGETMMICVSRARGGRLVLDL
ncbi:ferredoxin-NADP reductase [Prauserella muralis]|nr:PDR/VanB family oxidoreductase [Prauserella muralis]TWE27745.1 ferredoxin-NADP reductase [Prauserella muralis]